VPQKIAATAVTARVFLDQACTPGEQVTLSAEDAHHLTSVLRLRPGDELVVVGAGVAWSADFVSAGTHACTVSIRERLHDGGRELPADVTILQALPKAAKMDDIVEKVTELGAAAIVGVRCERSYGGSSEHKIERWRRIARAAAAQAQRLHVPRVDGPWDFAVALERHARDTHVLVASERAPRGSLSTALADIPASAPLALAIGPEGSFSPAEVALARAAGARLVSLGPTILRTETAAPAALAAIAALRGWW
jgi:16S rRNA (uracil1498-N3)-methyltransferase